MEDMENMENMENMALGGETHGRAGCRCGGGIHAHGTTLVVVPSYGKAYTTR